MAQGNMLLGMARGSVGDVTFARSARKQVSRARNRKPNNPRTVAQCKQRVLMKTAALAYAAFAKDLADQTFEGAANARENQQKFIKYNVEMLRKRESEDYSLYSGKGATESAVNRFILSKGSLFSAFWLPGKLDGGFALATPAGVQLSPEQLTTAITYRQFAELIGLPVGCQLTAVIAQLDSITVGDASVYTNIRSIARYRLILAPSDGDVDKPMFAGTGTLRINDPNSKNIGTWQVANDGAYAGLAVSGVNHTFGALIASSFDKKWRYSDAVFSHLGNPSDQDEPGDIRTENNFEEAVDSWLRAGMSESEEYTRQAE